MFLNTLTYLDASQTVLMAGGFSDQARFGHTATLLSDGRVLIAGGFGGSATLAVTLANGATSVALGSESGSILGTAEIYNPTTKTFSCVGGVLKKTGLCKGTMRSSRFEHTATVLDNGEVLLAGGFGAVKKSGLVELNTAEIFRNNTFAKAGAMTSARALAAATKILP